MIDLPDHHEEPRPSVRPACLGVARRLLGMREVVILLITAAVSVALTLTTASFLSPGNLNGLFIGLVTDAIIAIAMTMVLITGGFDLSVGSVLALSGMIVAKLLHDGTGLVPAILVTLVAAGGVGLANGLIIAKIGVNPLITTLGMMGIASGLTLVLSGGYPVSNLPKSFLYLGQGTVFGAPVAVVVCLALVLAGDFLLRRSRGMRLIYYVGGNERAALLSGIPVDRVRIWVYVFCGIMAAVAGILATARLGSAFPLAGKGAELRVISACVIGGCSLKGGEGTVLGALLGVLLMAIISNGLVLLNVSINWQSIVSGAILIAAVMIDRINQRRTGG